jgi:hypothetical protein
MTHDVYVFGSICRGESGPTSDVDVLVIPLGNESAQFPGSWSVYSRELIQEYYSKGRLFAWHLHLEAKCVFSANELPFLNKLGSPAPYSNMYNDIDDLDGLLQQALFELNNGTNNVIYELGIAYTALRDLAMSASWAFLGAPCFSSDAPYRLPINFPLPLKTYNKAMLARHSSTRGTEFDFDFDQVVEDLIQAPLEQWVESLKVAK